MNCQCEYIDHIDDSKAWTEQGCKNLATIVVSPSWTICTACEATMGVATGSAAGLEVADVGPYAGKVWHVVTPPA